MSNPFDQVCRAVMSTDPVVVAPTDSIDTATGLLLKHRVLSLPVVDDQRRYLGLFLKSRLIAMLMPKVLSADPGGFEIGRMMNVGFITEGLQDVRERYAAVKDNSVTSCLDTDSPVLRPDTPLMRTLFFLHRRQNFLPVVDETSGQLLGVISTWDVIARVTVE